MNQTAGTSFARPSIAARTLSAVLVVSYMALSAAPLGAVTLTNRDTKAYSVEVRHKSVRRQHELEPGKTMAKFCKAGCIIRLNGSAENDYALEGTERVSIEGGLVYYDGEEIKQEDGSETGDAEKQ